MAGIETIPCGRGRNERQPRQSAPGDQKQAAKELLNSSPRFIAAELNGSFVSENIFETTGAKKAPSAWWPTAQVLQNHEAGEHRTGSKNIPNRNQVIAG
ncbi:MAG TPA: hypothetical protein VNW15_11135 [Rhizomicrobium sp.]|jgi:hypothetical protein|nr:hypothetical protein [Rhizomicrobium sp.]